MGSRRYGTINASRIVSKGKRHWTKLQAQGQDKSQLGMYFSFKASQTEGRYYEKVNVTHIMMLSCPNVGYVYFFIIATFRTMIGRYC